MADKDRLAGADNGARLGTVSKDIDLNLIMFGTLMLQKITVNLRTNFGQFM